MISTAPIITESGKSLLLRSIGGEIITFTRFKIGNGVLPAGDDGSEMTDLINSVLAFPIHSIDTSMENNVKVEGLFDSTDIHTDFRWTEIGVFCAGEASCKFSGDGATKVFVIADKPLKLHKVLVDGDPTTITSYNASTGAVTLESAPDVGTDNITAYYTDSNEVLYAYSNDGENAGTLKANMTAVVAEQTVAFIIAVGEAENVTAILSQSLIFASKADFDSHIAAENPHHITAAQVGLGNVPNETTNSQKPTYTIKASLTELVSGETLENAFAKLARAVKNLIAHLANRSNPHGVTYTQAGAAKAQHTHNASEINAGILPASRGGTGCSSISELKRLLGLDATSGSYIGNGANYQFIPLNFTPSKVTVMPFDASVTLYNSGIATNIKNSALAEEYEDPSYANPNSLNTYYPYIKVAISENGFYVCYSSDSSRARTNVGDVSYSYAAER